MHLDIIKYESHINDPKIARLKTVGNCWLNVKGKIYSDCCACLDLYTTILLIKL